MVSSNWLSTSFLGLAALSSSVFAAAPSSSCPGLTVSHDGTPAGEFKNISGNQVYITYPPGPRHGKPRAEGGKEESFTSAILYVTDIFGVPLLQNKRLADSLARAGHLVLAPDLFHGDAVPENGLDPSSGFDFAAWRTRHGVNESDAVVASTLAYMKNELKVQKVGAVGYCWGGKYVPRFMANKGIDVGFIAHPSSLTTDEIRGIGGPISIAAGDLDDAFNATARAAAESILFSKNTTYQTSLYSGAPHGFGVKVDLTNKRQKFAKEAAFYQAVTWFDGWL